MKRHSKTPTKYGWLFKFQRFNQSNSRSCQAANCGLCRGLVNRQAGTRAVIDDNHSPVCQHLQQIRAPDFQAICDSSKHHYWTACIKCYLIAWLKSNFKAGVGMSKVGLHETMSCQPVKLMWCHACPLAYRCACSPCVSVCDKSCTGRDAIGTLSRFPCQS